MLASLEMQTALEGGATALASSTEEGVRASAAGPPLLAATSVLVGFSLFFGGGSSDDRLLWIGGGALLAATASGAAVLWGRLPAPAPSRWGTACIVLLAGFVLWNGISVVWSVAPDRSWSYFNRGLAYLAFLLVGLFVGSLVPRAPRLLAGGLAALLGLALLWALAGKAIPALFPDGGRIARLRAPVGYWNALALLGDVALPLGLWAAARRQHPHTVRAGGALLVYTASVAIVLTYSRGGVAIGAIAVAIWLVLGHSRLGSLAALAIAAPVAAGVSAWAFTRSGLVDDLQGHAVRVRDGAWFAGVFAGGALLVCALAVLASRQEASRPVSPARSRQLVVWASAGLALGLVAVAVGLAVRGPAPWTWVADRIDELNNPANVQVPQEPSRLATFSSNNRVIWWGEAWDAFTANPVIGTGAGSFELTNQLLRKNSLSVTEPHNAALQFLSETGGVGFLLAVGAAITGLASARRALRRLEGPERAAGAALAVVAPAYLLHALIDIDWDFVAVSGPLFLVLGVLAASGRSRERPGPGRRLAAGGAVLLALAALGSLAVPWLAERKVSGAYSAIGSGDLGRAVADAKAAHSLNPLSIDPLHAWAAAESARGDLTEARRRYVQAVNLQPLNSRTWYELGAFEFRALRDARRALPHLDRSYALDAWGPAGALLDQVRAVIEGRASYEDR